MKDLIEERDRRAKIQRSVIKSWNVHYMTPEELKEFENKHTQDAVLERLQAEAEADDAMRQAEVEAAKQRAMELQSQGWQDEASGVSDTVTQGQIERILGEKEANLRSIIEEETKLE